MFISYFVMSCVHALHLQENMSLFLSRFNQFISLKFMSINYICHLFFIVIHIHFYSIPASLLFSFFFYFLLLLYSTFFFSLSFFITPLFLNVSLILSNSQFAHFVPSLKCFIFIYLIFLLNFHFLDAVSVCK